jgi:hypothetical protein
MSSKKKTVKKVLVKLDTSKMTPAERVQFARNAQNTAKQCPAYTGSATAQASMTTWQTAANALDQNQSSIAQAVLALQTLRGQEGQLVYNYDVAAADYGGVVQTLANGVPSIVTGMGLAVKADATPSPAIVAPTGLMIATSKAGVDSLVWDKVPGARLYVMQYSPDPATDASWVTMPGGGRRRKLVGLVHGQKYVLRVMAMGAKQSGPWSATLGVVAK